MKFVRIISLFLLMLLPGQYLMAAVAMEVPQQADTARQRFIKKLHELRTVLNEQAEKLSDPAVFNNIMNLLRILLVLGAFAAVGYKAYQKTFGTPRVVSKGKPSTSIIPPQEQYTAPAPSYNATIFFRKIESLLPQSIGYLDFVIPQLEGQYGPARLVQMNGLSLIGAALYAKDLNTFNKIELIRWLKKYGIMPTEGDRNLAQQIGNGVIIDAINE